MKGRLLLFGAFALSGCTDNDTYTLYRNSPSFSDMRIHVASFDTGDGENYNRENCQVAGSYSRNSRASPCGTGARRIGTGSENGRQRPGGAAMSQILHPTTRAMSAARLYWAASPLSPLAPRSPFSPF
jgi:hypothetical protein